MYLSLISEGDVGTNLHRNDGWGMNIHHQIITSTHH